MRIRHFKTLFVLCVLLMSCQSAYCEEIKFPENFAWGAAVAAYQVEGGNSNSNWYEFEKIPGKVKDKCGAACDHFNRYESDFDLASALGVKIFRTSIEWSRIEPSEGVYDNMAIEHYRRYFTELKKRGLKPMVTLFHFTLPSWIVKKGGWCSGETIGHYTRFCEKMAFEYGDMIDMWTTHNEPTVYTSAGYLNGMWPPGEKFNVLKYRVVLGNLVRAHGAAYRAIKASDARDADGDGVCASVGIVTNYCPMMPGDPKNSANVFISERINYIANQLVLDALTTGKFDMSKIKGIFDGRSVTLFPAEPGTLDYIGINYYTRMKINLSITNPLSGMQAGGPASRGVESGAAGPDQTDMGWEIYPEGLYKVMMAVKQYDLPVFITENGIADASGGKRVKFLADHLIQLKRAVNEGVRVAGYIHWSFMDNFEWAEGFGKRFGLYSVDYATQKRSLTEGGAFYTEVCRNNGINEAMFKSVYGSKEDKAEKVRAIESLDKK